MMSNARGMRVGVWVLLWMGGWVTVMCVWAWVALHLPPSGCTSLVRVAWSGGVSLGPGCRDIRPARLLPLPCYAPCHRLRWLLCAGVALGRHPAEEGAGEKRGGHSCGCPRPAAAVRLLGIQHAQCILAVGGGLEVCSRAGRGCSSQAG